MNRMNTREKAVVLQLLLSRNVMIEKWDAHRITLKMVGLKGGMMNAAVVTIADSLGMEIVNK